jgi:RimJ/RimL family protein N-acetyltransferase
MGGPKDAHAVNDHSDKRQKNAVAKFLGAATATVTTSRLSLTSASTRDLEPMVALHADERVWRHLPAGRHVDPERTRRLLVECERQWETDGLGYWVARLRQPLGELSAGAVAGIGGCGRTAGTSRWNLYYRLAPEVQRQGLATELCRAALDAARRVRPDLPVVAYLLEHNLASKATAERLGLVPVWRGHDAGNPDPDAVRLIYADRPLDETQLKDAAHAS